MVRQKFAYIKEKYQVQGIRWLRLSPGKSIDDGVFILLHKEVSKTCMYDYWFEDIEIAEKWAEKYFGVKPSDWQSAEDLLSKGIQIYDEM